MTLQRDAPPITSKLDRFLRDERPRTPFVVVDVDVVEERYAQLTRALPGARVLYAVKANPAGPVLRRLVSLGSGFDIASPGEIDLCLEAGASAGDMSYGNTIKKRRDIAYAASVGVPMYTVDSPEELDKVLETVPAPGTVCVRLFHDCTGADWPLSRKFGCSVDTAARLLTTATEAGWTSGVSFHVGSQQRHLHAWNDALTATAQLFDDARELGARPSFVNLGGGFPGTYLDQMPPIHAYGTAISTALARAFKGKLDGLFIEPGRYMVADAGVLRSEVVLVSQRSRDDAQRWVYLDCGRFHGLAETMDEAIRYQLRTPHDGGETGPVAIAGPTCDSADILYEKTDYQLPLALAEGDFVDIMATGAYTTTYSSVGFNGFPPLDEHYI
jgi:ornithine decarboxylase